MDPSHYLRSDLLSRAGFTHAFFTRQGGVSSGAFGTLNLSSGVGDRPEDVAENWSRVARVLGLGEEHVFVPRQVHERSVVVVDGRTSSAQVALTPADAVISDGPGLACAVRTADCVPILVADRQTRRVAAIHAGWRGVVQGVTRAAVEALLERGSRPEELIAAIGPHISLAAFEVGDEVARELAGASDALQVVTQHDGQKPHVALARIVRAQLTRLGVPNDNVEELPGCTFSDASRFFSYRRDGRHSGRQVSAIVSEPIV
jgi:purine-nucleoside/S-methyl-5'-thioadenosine phosphorylase / adenosine deaminase